MIESASAVQWLLAMLSNYSDVHGPHVEAADLMIRLKKSGSGFHYGTAVNANIVAHKTPEEGKHLDTLDGFCGGLPCWRQRFARTPEHKAHVVQIALSDLGDPWTLIDNCEKDATRAQSGGAGFSPTVNKVVGLGVVGLLTLLAITIADN